MIHLFHTKNFKITSSIFDIPRKRRSMRLYTVGDYQRLCAWNQKEDWSATPWTLSAVDSWRFWSDPNKTKTERLIKPKEIEQIKGLLFYKVEEAINQPCELSQMKLSFVLKVIITVSVREREREGGCVFCLLSHIHEVFIQRLIIFVRICV